MSLTSVHFVEGCGQGEFGANWGDGFVTEPSLIRAGSKNDPSGFFTAIIENDFKCGPSFYLLRGPKSLSTVQHAEA
jgi:hypothetical protein